MADLTRPSQPIRHYGVPLSGHSHRIKLFLTLLDLPFESINVNLGKGENRRPEYLAMSPFGHVPVIEDGDVVLYDSNAILTYLAKRYGDPTWLPTDPIGAAHVQQWLSLAAGPIAFGPCTARLVKLFGADHDYGRAVAISQRLFDTIEPLLGRSPFATGDTPTIADIAAHTYIAHAPEGGISLEPYPNIRAWLDRVAALPRFVAMASSKSCLAAN